MYLLTHKHTRTRTHTHTHVCTNTHTCTCMHNTHTARVPAHTCTHAYTHMHTHVHMQRSSSHIINFQIDLHMLMHVANYNMKYHNELYVSNIKGLGRGQLRRKWITHKTTTDVKVLLHCMYRTYVACTDQRSR